MTDILLLQDRVKNTIQLGESHFREFKSALEGPPESKRKRAVRSIAADIGEALVAFANADGGELLIGVEDDGTVTGVPHDDTEIAQLLAAPTTHVHADSELPISQAQKLIIGDKPVLFFAVAKGTTEIYQLPDGRCMRRKDKSTVPETAKRILFDRQETKSREYDRHFVDGASVSDLDLGLLQTLADSYLRGLSVERYLQQLGVAEYGVAGLRLRMAAVLLFAVDIQRWHPRSQVRILKVSGTDLRAGEGYNVQSDEAVHGNILELLVNAWEKLRPFLAYKTEFGSDALFEQKYLYPELACREALVNALAHRDYSTHNGIDVFIFDDRMEIRSPGALLSTLTVKDLEDLQGAHESRNALIAKVLRENKFMRELGEGMRRMFALMEENEMEHPRLLSDGTSFSITLPNKSVFSARQEEWLNLFNRFDLSPRQKRIIAVGVDEQPLSQSDIYRAMNTEDRDTYDIEVTGLRRARILIEIRTNASASNYRKRHKIPKAQVPRFKVQLPSEGTTPNNTDAPTGGRGRFANENPNAKIYVGNLPSSINKRAVQAHFERCGPIVDIFIPKRRVGEGQNYAFIRFEDEESAKRAIAELNGSLIDGVPLEVRAPRPRRGPTAF